MRLRDRVAIITGAGRGIGQEMAESFAAEGASVVVADCDLGSAQRVAAEIASAGHVALSVRVDVADPTLVDSLVRQTLERFGRIDILVNNAGVGSNEPFLTISLEEWNRNLQINLTGTFLCAQAAARVMVSQGSGKIVNVASISGQRGGQGRAAYGASKAGVILLTKVMAVELAPHGIRVNAISPGPVDTDQSRATHTPATRRAYFDRLPVERYGERREIAAAALFLASDEASFVHGHILNVDGGFDAAGLIFSDNEPATPQANGAANGSRGQPLPRRSSRGAATDADITTAPELAAVMRTRYRVLGMLVLLSMITYLDRICIIVAAPTMKEELGISTEAWGWVLSVFFISYGVFEIPTGAAGDRWGQRRMLTRIVVWWSVFTSITGMVSSYWALLTVRFMFGAGEAGAYPNAAGCAARWFPSQERARAQGFIWGASRLGGALSPVLVVPIMAFLHWRTAFWIFGAVGIVWAVAWYWWYRDRPEEHPAVTPAELAEIGTSTGGAAHHQVPWARLFSSPQLWLIMLMYFTYVCGGIFYMSRLSEFLVEGRGLTKEAMGVVYSLAFLMGAAGNVAGGFLCDHLKRRHGAWVGYCLLGACSLMGAGLFLLAAAIIPGKLSAAVFLILGFGVMDCMLPAAWATCVDVGKQYSGSVSGAMNTAGQAGGALFSVLYGYLVTAWGSFDTPIIPMAMMMFISAVVFLFIDPTRPLVPDDAPSSEEQLACA